MTQKEENNKGLDPTLNHPVMPDDALIRAVGVANFSGPKKEHVMILAAQIKYLRVQLNIIANTYDDETLGNPIREYVNSLHKNSDESLLAILKP